MYFISAILHFYRNRTFALSGINSEQISSVFFFKDIFFCGVYLNILFLFSSSSLGLSFSYFLTISNNSNNNSCFSCVEQRYMFLLSHHIAKAYHAQPIVYYAFPLRRNSRLGHSHNYREAQKVLSYRNAPPDND